MSEKEKRPPASKLARRIATTLFPLWGELTDLIKDAATTDFSRFPNIPAFLIDAIEEAIITESPDVVLNDRTLAAIQEAAIEEGKILKPLYGTEDSEACIRLATAVAELRIRNIHNLALEAERKYKAADLDK